MKTIRCDQFDWCEIHVSEDRIVKVRKQFFRGVLHEKGRELFGHTITTEYVTDGTINVPDEVLDVFSDCEKIVEIAKELGYDAIEERVEFKGAVWDSYRVYAPKGSGRIFEYVCYMRRW